MASPVSLSLEAQAQTRIVSCNLTIGRALHRGDDCVLRRLAPDREELRGGELRVEISYRSQGGERQQVLLNGRAGSQTRLALPTSVGMSGITEDASVAYQWWTTSGR